MEEKTSEIVSPTEPIEVPKEQDINKQIAKKQEEINRLRQEAQQKALDKENVEILEHKHCSNCQKVFYNENVQIKTCLRCNPGRI